SDPACAIGFSTRLDAELEGLSHQGRVLSLRDRRVNEDRVGAELDRQRSFGRSTKTGVDNDGDAGVFDDDLDLLHSKDTAPGPDGRPKRHNGGATGLFESLGEYRVGVDVRQN